jgi:hypothetical protein
VPFPLEAELERLRKVARALNQAYRETVALGQRLGRIQKNWPPERPAAALDVAQKEYARLQKELDSLRGKLQL